MAGGHRAGCGAAARSPRNWARKAAAGGRRGLGGVGDLAEKAGASCEFLSAKQLDVCNQTAFTLTKAKKPEVADSAFESVGFAVMFCEEIVVAMFSAGEACEEEFIDDDEEPADLYKGSFSRGPASSFLPRSWASTTRSPSR